MSARGGHQRYRPWWHHQMETFPALLALCEGNPPVTGGFTSQRPVRRSFDVFLDLRLNKRLSKQMRRKWFESHYDVTVVLFRSTTYYYLTQCTTRHSDIYCSGIYIILPRTFVIDYVFEVLKYTRIANTRTNVVHAEPINVEGHRCWWHILMAYNQ